MVNLESFQRYGREVKEIWKTHLWANNSDPVPCLFSWAAFLQIQTSQMCLVFRRESMWVEIHSVSHTEPWVCVCVGVCACVGVCVCVCLIQTVTKDALCIQSLLPAGPAVCQSVTSKTIWRKSILEGKLLFPSHSVTAFHIFLTQFFNCSHRLSAVYWTASDLKAYCRRVFRISFGVPL